MLCNIFIYTIILVQIICFLVWIYYLLDYGHFQTSFWLVLQCMNFSWKCFCFWPLVGEFLLVYAFSSVCQSIRTIVHLKLAFHRIWLLVFSFLPFCTVIDLEKEKKVFEVDFPKNCCVETSNKGPQWTQNEVSWIEFL